MHLDMDSRLVLLCLLLVERPQPRSPLFPYTTLFRSPLAEPRPDRLFGGVPDVLAHGRGGYRIGPGARVGGEPKSRHRADRKSTRLNSSHRTISYAVFCLKTKKKSPCHLEDRQDAHER